MSKIHTVQTNTHTHTHTHIQTHTNTYTHLIMLIPILVLLKRILFATFSTPDMDKFFLRGGIYMSEKNRMLTFKQRFKKNMIGFCFSQNEEASN